VHFHNAPPDNSKISNECLTEFLARRVPRPVYSPDDAPNCFFAFGIVKTELDDYEILNRQDLILRISAVFNEIPKGMLNSVYVLWIGAQVGDSE
jgi:hypothetical protein